MSNNNECKVRGEDNGTKFCFIAVALNPLLALYPDSISLSPCQYPDATTRTCLVLKNVNTEKLPDLSHVTKKKS